MTVHTLLSLALLVLGANVAARVTHRLGLPPVLGELLLGLAIGPSLLGWVAPTETLRLIAEIGVILLMFMAGLETDLAAMRRVGRASLLTALGGVIVPLAGGMATGLALRFGWRQALCLGAVLTATSVSISAQTLRDMGVLRSREGTAILGAAVIDDVLAMLVFALVLSLTGGSNLLVTVAKMAFFFPVAWLVGDRIVPLLADRAGAHNREASVAVLLGLVLLFAWAAEALGSVATITGAYLLGALVARHTDAGHTLHSDMSAVGYALFVPIFFVSIGLQARADGLWQAPWLAGLLITLAVVSKIVGCGIGARLGGLDSDTALRVDCGMVSRGEVALVMAGAGLASGLLDAALFSQIIIVTLATTVLTPPLLQLVYHRPALAGLGAWLRPVRLGARWQDFVLEE